MTVHVDKGALRIMPDGFVRVRKLNNIQKGIVKKDKLSEIKKYGKKESTARDFLNHFNKWKSNVIRSAENYNFYDKKSKAMPIIILILTTLVFMFLNMIPLIL